VWCYLAHDGRGYWFRDETIRSEDYFGLRAAPDGYEQQFKILDPHERWELYASGGFGASDDPWEVLTGTDETETAYTDLFDKGWPGTPHRVVENETVERFRAAGEPPLGDRPGEDDVVARSPHGDPIERYDEALATPGVEGDVDEMALFAGQSAGLTEEIRPAGDVVADLVAETEAAVVRVAADHE